MLVRFVQTSNSFLDFRGSGSEPGRGNPTRTDFLHKFEQLFKALLKLSASLSSEQQRHIREHLSEEELTLFDILLKPAPELSESERRKVKAVARELLEKVKALLVLNWCAKAASHRPTHLSSITRSETSSLSTSI